MLLGDGPRLTQVFVNLLANAGKFSPEASTIRVGAKQEGERVVAWVEDEGAGVPDIELGSDLRSLFTRTRRRARTRWPRTRPLDRQVDYRAPWRHCGGEPHRR